MTETKWNHISDNSNNKNKNEPYIDSKFKEMFQNIYSKSDNKEGFSILAEFDMHAEREKLNLNTETTDNIANALTALKDFILCPFYKSDEIIDSALQTLLSIFLAVDCNELIYDDSGNSETTAIVDMTDLIDPQLLYNDRSGFTTMSNTSTKEGFNTECGEQKEKAEEDVIKYSHIIKDQIYRILFFPIVIHIFYNIYFMFCFKDILGNRIPFIDIEKDYYEPYLKEQFDYFLGIVIKPVSILRFGLDFIAKNKTLRYINDNVPYVTYIFLFVIIQSIVEGIGKNIILIIGELLTGKTSPAITSVFAIGVMAYYFFRQGVDSFKGWADMLKSQPISGSIKFLIYWIIKLVINLFIFPVGAYLCNVYFIAYMIFGIFISQEKDVFDVYQDILDMVLDKVYGLYDPVCGTYSTFWWFIQQISKFGVLYLFEFTIYLILSSGMYEYYKHVDNVNIQSFFVILNFTGMVILGMWCFMKFITTVRDLDSKYSVVNTNEKKELDKKKEERVKNEMPNVAAEKKKKEEEEGEGDGEVEENNNETKEGEGEKEEGEEENNNETKEGQEEPEEEKKEE